MSGIKRELDEAIIPKAGTCDFDHQKDVFGTGRAAAVIVGFGAKDGKVRLRLGVVIKHNRVTRRHDTMIADRHHQGPIERVGTTCMTGSDRIDGDDLSLDQLNPIVLMQNAGFTQASDGIRAR